MENNMEDYLLDREVLDKLIDELIKKRPLPIDNASELADFKEKQMHALDDRVSGAIFGSLSPEQVSTLSQLLDQETSSPDAFRDFFTSQNIDIEDIIVKAIKSFTEEFLKGGQNV